MESSDDQGVHLATTAPAEPPSGALMLYSTIKADTVSRSGVLQCIVEAGGHARLPDSVSLPEFIAWTEACEIEAEARKKLSIEYICKTLRVRLLLHVCRWCSLRQLAGVLPRAVDAARSSGMTWPVPVQFDASLTDPAFGGISWRTSIDSPL